MTDHEIVLQQRSFVFSESRMQNTNYRSFQSERKRVIIHLFKETGGSRSDESVLTGRVLLLMKKRMKVFCHYTDYDEMYPVNINKSSAPGGGPQSGVRPQGLREGSGIIHFHYNSIGK